METKNQDEIDLVALAVKFVRTIRKNIVLISLMVLAGAGAAYVWASAYPKTYQSKMLMTSDILTFSYAEKLINTLHELAGEGNYETLEQRLNLSRGQVENIAALTLTSGVEGAGLEERKKNYLVISVRLKKLEGLDSLQHGLVQYFENNDFVKIRVRQRKELYQQLVKDVETEIQSLEVLKQNMYSGDFIGKTKGNIMFDPTIVNTKIIDLKRHLFNYRDSLELVNSVEVIDGFTSFNTPIAVRKKTATLVGAFLGGLLAFTIIAFRALIVAVRQAEQKNA